MMSRSMRPPTRMLVALLLAPLLGWVTLVAAEKPGFVTEVVVRDLDKSLTKAELELLHSIHSLVSDDPALARKVSDELSDAISLIEGNANAAAGFFRDLKQITSKADLVKLTEAHKLRAHAASVLESTAANFAGKSNDLLRNFIGLSDEGADLIGQEALKLLRQAEDEIATHGVLSATLDLRLAEAVRKLPPARAGAARQLLRNKLAAKGTSAFNMFLRTGVDSLFVLKDAYDISAMKDGSQKGTAATATAVGFGLDMAGNVAVRALGGGAFLHGLVISLSAGKVAQLVSEIIQLQYDREHAATQEEWARMQQRLDTIQGMVKVDALIKAGELDKAQTLLAKVKHYYFKRPILAADDDSLYAQMVHLEQVANRAGQLLRANEIIAEARVPFTLGYQLAARGRRLNLARNHVLEARQILSGSVHIYPELQPALNKALGLLAAIDKLLANPPPLRKASISGPKRMVTGDVQTFQVTVEGGIPDFQPININGLALTTGALVYWQAPSTPGPARVKVRLRDDTGQTIEASTQVEVVDPEPATDQSQTLTGEVRLRGFRFTESYRQNGRDYPSEEVEAREVHVGDSVHFAASPENRKFQYRWSVNGKVNPEPNFKHIYSVYPQEPGVYRVAVAVSDTSGKALGQAEWVFKAVEIEFDIDFIDPRLQLVPRGE